MSTAVAEIEAKIRELSLEDKADLVRSLIAELDGPADADVERAWLEEAKRRHRTRISLQTLRGSAPTGSKLPRMKVKELIELLVADGWFQVRMKGSHRQFHHRTKKGTVTVAGKPSIDIPPGTLNSALKQAGLKKEK